MTVPIDLFLHPKDKAPIKQFGNPHDVVGKSGMANAVLNRLNLSSQQKLRREGVIKVDDACKPYRKQYRMLKEISEKLGIDLPQLYVLPDADARIISFGDVTSHIVLSSGLIERVSSSELGALLARECGHFLCRHSRWLFIAHAILEKCNSREDALAWFKDLLSVLGDDGVRFAIKFASWGGKIIDSLITSRFGNGCRFSEFTADRVAAYVMRDANVVWRAVARLQGQDVLMLERLATQIDSVSDIYETAAQGGDGADARDLTADRVCDLLRWFAENRGNLPPYASANKDRFAWFGK